MRLELRDRVLDLAAPVVMGILNVTPDSFSDGGQFSSPDRAVRRALEMVVEGAAIIDVGGESTRPGAADVSVQEELDRVCPVIERLRQEVGVVLSVDTSQPQVMAESIRLGVDLINDVRALEVPGAAELVVRHGMPVCLMHMRGAPRTMQQAPVYTDVVGEVRDFLCHRAAALVNSGLPRERILLDPGFGFGKRLEDNLRLMAHLECLASCGFPVLVGVSRKSMIGAVTGRDVGGRLAGSLGLAVLAGLKGARVLRVHDVAETVDALKVVEAVRQFDGGQE